MGKILHFPKRPDKRISFSRPFAKGLNPCVVVHPEYFEEQEFDLERWKESKQLKIGKAYG